MFSAFTPPHWAIVGRRHRFPEFDDGVKDASQSIRDEFAIRQAQALRFILCPDNLPRFLRLDAGRGREVPLFFCVT